MSHHVIGNEFKRAVNPRVESGGGVNDDVGSFDNGNGGGTGEGALWRTWNYCKSASWFWGLVVFTLMFIFLYCLNAPLTQNKTDNDEPLVRPSPNVTIVFALSFMTALLVTLSPWLSTFT